MSAMGNEHRASSHVLHAEDFSNAPPAELVAGLKDTHG